jgi:REP element-mobilizing transposase RayT
MPPKARIDSPSALHHIIVRGIARRKVFDDNADRDFFIERLAMVLLDTGTQCFAWALIPNHFHLPLKTGATPIATVMKRLLIGYAMHYNRRHNRHGHLFQINLLRAKLVSDLKGLDKNPYGGHSVLMGRVSAEWQDPENILGMFGGKVSIARRRYREFVQKGIAAGKRRDLTGGGLIRSVGGWSAGKSLRKAGAFQKGDERILGDGEFVENVLSQAKEAFETKYRLKAKGINVDSIASRVGKIMSIDPAQIWAPGKQPKVVRARSLLCYWATSELGISQVWLSKKLGLSQAAVSLSVARGRQIVSQETCEIGNL